MFHEAMRVPVLFPLGFSSFTFFLVQVITSFDRPLPLAPLSRMIHLRDFPFSKKPLRFLSLCSAFSPFPSDFSRINGMTATSLGFDLLLLEGVFSELPFPWRDERLYLFGPLQFSTSLSHRLPHLPPNFDPTPVFPPVFLVVKNKPGGVFFGSTFPGQFV